MKDNLSINIKNPLDSSETNAVPAEKITRRLIYFKKRYGLEENQILQFSHQYRNIPQTRELIEKAFREFIRINRLKRIKSTIFQGKKFLYEIQELIIQIYQSTKMGKLFPNGYPIIV